MITNQQKVLRKLIKKNQQKIFRIWKKAYKMLKVYYKITKQVK